MFNWGSNMGSTKKPMFISIQKIKVLIYYKYNSFLIENDALLIEIV